MTGPPLGINWVDGMDDHARWAMAQHNQRCLSGPRQVTKGDSVMQCEVCGNPLSDMLLDPHVVLAAAVRDGPPMPYNDTLDRERADAILQAHGHHQPSKGRIGVVMAGSYGHVVDDEGRLMVSTDVNGMLENGGDVYEAVEEMYGMIHWLATRLADATGTPKADLVAEAQRQWVDGVVMGGRRDTEVEVEIE